MSPSAIDMKAGESRVFTVSVTGIGKYSDGVIWSVIGETSAGTSITQKGVLTVDSDEISKHITVVATSVTDSKKSGESVVTLENAATPTPTAIPTETPTAVPTASPTTTPTTAPTATPTLMPTAAAESNATTISSINKPSAEVQNITFVPSTSTQSGNSEDASTSTSSGILSSASPGTGDLSNTIFYLLLAMAAAGVMGGMIRIGRRREKDGDG